MKVTRLKFEAMPGQVITRPLTDEEQDEIRKTESGLLVKTSVGDDGIVISIVTHVPKESAFSVDDWVACCKYSVRGFDDKGTQFNIIPEDQIMAKVYTYEDDMEPRPKITRPGKNIIKNLN